ncbi:hypothetical protein NQ318_019313 [Aromia moschata]|uniref:Uncharacterized protein n=1 Tax=Aromia moschata TaxID=1265417 RepID=A0AAV8YB90_9CUCU|nr:hypothetical protein NQ318_019313 [Aromia moschata]
MKNFRGTRRRISTEIPNNPLHRLRTHLQGYGNLIISEERYETALSTPGTLNAEKYLLETLIPFVQMLYDDELQQDYIQQDGARARIIRELINYIWLGIID